MVSNTQSEGEENSFLEFRRKVQAAEMLSSAMERLLRQLQFTGRLSVVVQNGRVLKSGYEGGYFRQPPILQVWRSIVPPAQ
jgi:hypothetical protein